MFPLILGSASPRRKYVMEFFTVPFSVVPSPYEEIHPSHIEHPDQYVCDIAKAKALSLQKDFPNNPILTADTIVYHKGKLFVKPTSDENAYAMLTELSGSCHQVFTGVCVLYKGECFVKAEESKVYFHDLTEKQKRIYHQVFFFQDKAAGYAIQKAGSIIVKKIEGCYYNILGMPINTTRELLAKIGVDLWDFLKGV